MREAIDSWVRSTWFASRATARALPIADQVAPSAHHVVLETFTETRTIDEVDRPYRGEKLPAADAVLLPDAWSIAVPRATAFEEGAQEIEVPRTARVANCEQCTATGQVTCLGCSGSGETTRSTDDGTVTDSCGPCRGSGKTRCGGCEGETRVVTYTRLTVRWMVHRVDRVIGTRGVPSELVANAPETEVATEEGETLATRSVVDGGPFRGGGAVSINADVAEAANELLAGHVFGGQTRIQRQRLSVRAVPLFEVPYKVGDEQRRLWIVGTDRQVYAPKFPVSRPRLGVATAIWAAVCATPIAWYLLTS